MAQTARSITYREIAKPNCPKCGTRMWLLRIEPQLASDRMTFECRCGERQDQEFAPGSSVPRLR